MFLKYKRELCLLDGLDDLVDDEQDYINDCNFFQTDYNAKWIAIKDEADNEIGFLVILTGRLIPPNLDYYIEDTYIQPEHRRKGIMRKAVEDFINAHEGRYGLEIMDKNKAAHSFWGKIVNERWYGESVPTHENCKEYYFDTRKES